MVHEFGHYFSLLHTFEGSLGDPCKNDDCLVDGDMVCDTPPDRSFLGECPDNSCDTDTLSNYSNQTFFIDTLDMSSNFMDYTSCATDFSHHQIDRMRFFIQQVYPDLPITSEDSRCLKPCEIAAEGFDFSEDPIIAGESVSIFATDRRFKNYEWRLSSFINKWDGEDSISSNQIGNSVSFNYTFENEGWQTVYLRAWNDDENCFTSFQRNVNVTCGVEARFSPDKRRNAAKQPDALFTDSVTFIDYSYGADTYEWKVSFSSVAGVDFPDFYSTD
ncbi:MAG: hypothetical protein HRT61_13980, partial [Ekhidna sp.]|nr:hypothetical protein [Ekhidna sp.]